jgi:hypothetical protein
VALVGVAAVVLDVAEVVEQVAGAGDRAEGDEGEERVGDLRRLVELLREHEAGEDEDVLDPLPRPHRHQQRERERRPRRRAALAWRVRAGRTVGHRCHREQG